MPQPCSEISVDLALYWSFPNAITSYLPRYHVSVATLLSDLGSLLSLNFRARYCPVRVQKCQTTLPRLDAVQRLKSLRP